MEMRFLHSILGRIISQNSVCYATKDKKVIQILDRIFIFEKIKKLSIAYGQGFSFSVDSKKNKKSFASPERVLVKYFFKLKKQSNSSYCFTYPKYINSRLSIP